MTAAQSAKDVSSYVAVIARAGAYGVRAARTKIAVERLKSRFEDRAASARYVSEAMTELNVDEPTTTAYMEVFTLSTAMADNVGGIVSASDSLAASAQGLESETSAQHGRMRELNQTHSVQMAAADFIKQR